MEITPHLFKGTRDYLPAVMIPREKIIEIVRKSFARYGFAPLATPAFEFVDILTGKSGGEADKLIYRLAYEDGNTLALHYDLTVPLARVAAMYPELPRPFKRYQIQPVWRADRPQLRQGRFREFTQCDADILGVNGLLADAEIIALTADILTRLGFGAGDRRFLIQVNDRRFLADLCRWMGLEPAEHLFGLCRALDKFDKTGLEGVLGELTHSGYGEDVLQRVGEFFRVSELTREPAQFVTNLRVNSPSDWPGTGQLFDLFSVLQGMNLPEGCWEWTPWLARGLDYYTGPIFEVVLPEHPHIGSLTGGGRYDGLIGRFGKEEIPAVGTTIGLDRIFAALEQLGMLRETPSRTQVLVAMFDIHTLAESLALTSELRTAGINTELYLETDKLKKQFAYADKLGIPAVVILGPDEVQQGTVTVKLLAESRQETLPLPLGDPSELVAWLKANLPA